MAVRAAHEAWIAYRSHMESLGHGRRSLRRRDFLAAYEQGAADAAESIACAIEAVYQSDEYRQDPGMTGTSAGLADAARIARGLA